jgi:hypothetical protein
MMRDRQKRYPKRYPKWSRRKQDSPRWICKERAGWKCEACGVAQRTILLNRDGEEYMCYLHAAHVHHLDPFQPVPIEGQCLRCLCPPCHGSYDWHYRELEHQITAHCILIDRFLLNRFTVRL